MERNSGLLVQLALFLVGSALLATMAIEAHVQPYFAGDVTVSHAVQAHSSDLLDMVLGDVSWFGFPPQSDALFGGIVVLLFALRARWAAVTEAMSAIGSGGLYLVLEHFVARPRPSADLVRVIGPIQLTGFPSGHLATFVAVFGFLAFLGYQRLAPSAMRFTPSAIVAVLIVVMAFARIYAGHHWASDVVAGTLLGGLWLFVVIRVYRWGEARFVQHTSRQSQKSHRFDRIAPLRT